MSQHLTLEEITIVADINTLGGGGTPGNSRWGVPPVSPNPDPVSEQKCHFPPPFSDLASKIQTHIGRNCMSTLLRLELQYFEIHFRICKLLFLSCSFGMETTNTLHSIPQFPRTIPNCRPKRTKSITVFRPKRRKNHTLRGSTEVTI